MHMQIEFAESSPHDWGIAGLSDGTIGVIAIKVFNASGTLVYSTYNDSNMAGTNLQVIEFDPRDYGTGTYTIEVILKQAPSDERVTNFGIAWR